MSTARDGGPKWLFLLHQLPAKPAYARVKVWRRLQSLGAVTVKNAVYALPDNSETREDFAWLAKEIVESGGEALVCEAELVEGLTDEELRATFERVRNEDYDRITTEAAALAARLDDSSDAAASEVAAQVVRLRRQLLETRAIDFFGAGARDAADKSLAALETRLQEGADMSEPTSAPPASGAEALRGKVWVTREAVQVDRIASAWLIRRFIDPGARFKFVPGRAYLPRTGEVRFDMFEGEYTHEGDRCTFEVLLQRAGLHDAALSAIGEIIHDIDLKDGKYGREETAGIRIVIAGIASGQRDDEERLARGGAVLDDLYQSLRGSIEEKAR
jgi:hypothetical protein